MTLSPPAAPPAADPLLTLRSYGALAPWSLRDLVTVTSAVLQASDIVPLSAAVRARPTERTIRFYVTRGLVQSPDGKGTAAVYGYRHFLQVLAIKLRQMEGATLDVLAREFAGFTGDMIERRVAAALGPSLPAPSALAIARPGRGRTARANAQWRSATASAPVVRCRRLLVAPGVELLVDEDHPALQVPGGEAALVEVLRGALDELQARG